MQYCHSIIHQRHTYEHQYSCNSTLISQNVNQMRLNVLVNLEKTRLQTVIMYWPKSQCTIPNRDTYISLYQISLSYIYPQISLDRYDFGSRYSFGPGYGFSRGYDFGPGLGFDPGYDFDPGVIFYIYFRFECFDPRYDFLINRRGVRATVRLGTRRPQQEKQHKALLLKGGIQHTS